MNLIIYLDVQRNTVLMTFKTRLMCEDLTHCRNDFKWCANDKCLQKILQLLLLNRNPVRSGLFRHELDSH